MPILVDAQTHGLIGKHKNKDTDFISSLSSFRHSSTKFPRMLWDVLEDDSESAVIAPSTPETLVVASPLAGTRARANDACFPRLRRLGQRC